MCPPNYLGARKDVHANKKEGEYFQSINADLNGFRMDAKFQWKNLKEKYNSLGIRVHQIPAVKNFTDQTYTADPAFTLVHEDSNLIDIITSCFSNDHRNEEIDVFKENLISFFSMHPVYKDYKICVHQMETAFEGTGDNLYDPYRDLIFSGYSTHLEEHDPSQGRSSIKSHKQLSQITNVDVISLEVQYPCFHIDTCLGLLPSGHALVYKNGLSQESHDHFIEKAFSQFNLNPDEYVIYLSKNDAENHFVTNFVCFENIIFMPCFGGNKYPPISQDLLRKLSSLGYVVHLHDVSEFIKVGGAIHCISHVLHTRIPHGLINQKGNS